MYAESDYSNNHVPLSSIHTFVYVLFISGHAVHLLVFLCVHTVYVRRYVQYMHYILDVHARCRCFFTLECTVLFGCNLGKYLHILQSTYICLPVNLCF